MDIISRARPEWVSESCEPNRIAPLPKHDDQTAADDAGEIAADVGRVRDSAHHIEIARYPARSPIAQIAMIVQAGR